MSEFQTILFLSHTQIVDDARILRSMSVAQKLHNIDVSAIGISSRLNSKSKSEEYDIIDIKLLSRSLKFFPTLIRHILSLFEFYIKSLYLVRSQRIKIVFCNDDTALFLAVIIKFWKSAKLIYDAHELECNRNGVSRLHGKFIYFIEGYLWRYVDHFITVSPSISDWYQKEFGRKESTIIYNTPKIQKEGKKIKSFHTVFNLRAEQKVFLYLGKLMPGRGLFNLIYTFSKLNDEYCFVMLGDGHLKSNLENKVKKLNCKNIFFHEPVSHDQVVGLAATANCGFCLLENVSKSDYLALPNKLFEYAFAGLPIIASDFPEIKKFLNKSGFGITLKNSEEIYALIQNIEHIKNFSPNKIYLNKFTWEAQGKLLYCVFEQTLQE